MNFLLEFLLSHKHVSAAFSFHRRRRDVTSDMYGKYVLRKLTFPARLCTQYGNKAEARRRRDSTTPKRVDVCKQAAFSSSPGGCASVLSTRTCLLREIDQPAQAQNTRSSRQWATWRCPAPTYAVAPFRKYTSGGCQQLEAAANFDPG